MTKVFISYAHSEQAWVLDHLIPVLEAGGAEIIIDVQHFRGGRGLTGEMDQWQDQADRHILVITKNYLASKPCLHELNRAIKLDPNFANGLILPIRRDSELWPRKITRPNPLYIDLRDDRDAGRWKMLLDGCGAELGAPAPHWLDVRNRIKSWLNDRRSVNLVVDNGRKVKPLLEHLGQQPGLAMPVIDLESGAVANRPALLQAMLRGLGSHAALPDHPKDLIDFHNEIVARGFSRVALAHGDLVRYHYKDDVPLFAALRHLINTERKLALLVHSHAPFQTLLPRDHPLSEIDMVTVTLSAAP
jgi:hypothetical protein